MSYNVVVPVSFTGESINAAVLGSEGLVTIIQQNRKSEEVRESEKVIKTLGNFQKIRRCDQAVWGLAGTAIEEHYKKLEGKKLTASQLASFFQSYFSKQLLSDPSSILTAGPGHGNSVQIKKLQTQTINDIVNVQGIDHIGSGIKYAAQTFGEYQNEPLPTNLPKAVFTAYHLVRKASPEPGCDKTISLAIVLPDKTITTYHWDTNFSKDPKQFCSHISALFYNGKREFSPAEVFRQQDDFERIKDQSDMFHFCILHALENLYGKHLDITDPKGRPYNKETEKRYEKAFIKLGQLVAAMQTGKYKTISRACMKYNEILSRDSMAAFKRI